MTCWYYRSSLVTTLMHTTVYVHESILNDSMHIVHLMISSLAGVCAVVMEVYITKPWALLGSVIHVGLKVEVQSSFLTLETMFGKTISLEGPLAFDHITWSSRSGINFEPLQINLFTFNVCVIHVFKQKVEKYMVQSKKN